jgi:hypothetical protein
VWVGRAHFGYKLPEVWQVEVAVSLLDRQSLASLRTAETHIHSPFKQLPQLPDVGFERIVGYRIVLLGRRMRRHHSSRRQRPRLVSAIHDRAFEINESEEPPPIDRFGHEVAIRNVQMGNAMGVEEDQAL